MADELGPVINLAQHGCKFAIKGGGHTPSAGAANIQDGILVDMSGFDDITVNKRGTVTCIGAGQKWINVYRKLDAMGLAVSGGRVGSVGVAGLTLGGGLSFFSPRYGFVCDNVVNYEIVLANGTLTSANATHHPSLFRALKGGSNNFGIVTSSSLRTFPQPPLSLWGGNVLYAPTASGFAPHFAAFESYVTNPKPDPYAAVIMNIAYSGQAESWFIIHNLAYTKRKADPAALKAFTKIEGRIHDTPRFSNLTDLAMEFENGIAAPGLRHAFATLTIIPSAPLLTHITTLSQTHLSNLLSVPGISWALSFQPLTPSTTANPNNNHGAGNILGLTAADGNMVNILLTVSYDNRDDDERVQYQIKEFVKMAREEASAVQGLKGFVYLNYAAPWQDPITRYTPANVAFLQNVSAQYDPQGIFQHRVPGGFKLFSLEERALPTEAEAQARVEAQARAKVEAETKTETKTEADTGKENEKQKDKRKEKSKRKDKATETDIDPDQVSLEVLRRLLKAVKSRKEFVAVMEAQRREQERMVWRMRVSNAILRMVREH